MKHRTLHPIARCLKYCTSHPYLILEVFRESIDLLTKNVFGLGSPSPPVGGFGRPSFLNWEFEHDTPRQDPEEIWERPA